MTQDTITTCTMTGHADLLGTELSEEQLKDLNAKLWRAMSPFSVSTAAVSIMGSCREDASLFAEIIINGKEQSTLEMNRPLKGSMARDTINKRLHDAMMSASSSWPFETLQSYFQKIADCCTFGKPVEFPKEPASSEKVEE